MACGRTADSDNTAIDKTAQHHVGIPVPSLCATFSLRGSKVTRNIWPKETLSLFEALLCDSFLILHINIIEEITQTKH